MSEIGIIRYSDAHPIPIASKEVGEPLALAFASSIEGVRDLFIDKVESGIVSRDELRQLRVLLPDQIPEGSDEQRLLSSVLFVEALSDRQMPRKYTLQLMMHASDILKTKPSQEAFRWLLYAKQTPEGEPLELPDELAGPAELWWIYQANDLLHIVYERFFSMILHLLASEPNGVALSVAAREAARLTAGDWARRSWKEYSDAIRLSPNANDASDSESDIALVRKICRKPANIEAQVNCAAHALQLLAVLLKRTELHQVAIATVYGKGGLFDREGLQSLLSEQRFLAGYESRPVEEVIFDLIMKRVIYRHQAIALHKLRTQGDYTFLFEIEEGLAVRRLPYEPVFTNPRATNALTFLGDLRLVSDEGPTEVGHAWMMAS